MKTIPFINIHTHHHLSDEGIVIVNFYKKFEVALQSTYSSIGIHPWYINEINLEESLHVLSELSQNKNILAIGECGLDKLIDINFKEQERIFKAQISIAEAIQKPIIVHCVKAFNELIHIKKKMNVIVPLIIHGYNNNKQIAEQLLKNGFYFSFGKALLNKKSNASKIISAIPIEKLFLETDDENMSIQLIFEAAAEYLEMDIEILKEKIFNNFNNVFKLNNH